MLYKTLATNKDTGEDRELVVSAESKNEAQKKILEMGYYPMEIKTFKPPPENPISPPRDKYGMAKRLAGLHSAVGLIIFVFLVIFILIGVSTIVTSKAEDKTVLVGTVLFFSAMMGISVVFMMGIGELIRCIVDGVEHLEKIKNQTKD